MTYEELLRSVTQALPETEGKLAIMRGFHSKTFMMWLLTPLHDETRKKRHWSDTQTVFRFAVVQLLCALTGLLIMAALH